MDVSPSPPNSTLILDRTLLYCLNYRKCLFVYNLLRTECRDGIIRTLSTQTNNIFIPMSNGRYLAFFMYAAGFCNDLSYHWKLYTFRAIFRRDCLNHFALYCFWSNIYKLYVINLLFSPFFSENSDALYDNLNNGSTQKEECISNLLQHIPDTFLGIGSMVEVSLFSKVLS